MIPDCHPLPIEFAQITHRIEGLDIIIETEVAPSINTLFIFFSAMFGNLFLFNEYSYLIFFPLMLLLGVAGWAIAGFTATVESTIAVYKVLHNTMFVPAHLHTNMLMGVTLFIFAFLFYFFFEKGKEYGGKIAKIGFWLFIAGGYGFVLTFFLEGISGIPRRYARYTGIGIKSMHDTAVHHAQIAVVFVIVLLIGLFMMYYALFSKFFKKKIKEN